MTRTLMFAAIPPHGFLIISLINEQPETSLGVFDNSVLDLNDDTLAARVCTPTWRSRTPSDCDKIQKKTKVIVAPYDVHSLRGSNGFPCDAYCQLVRGAWPDFYSNLSSECSAFIEVTKEYTR